MNNILKIKYDDLNVDKITCMDDFYYKFHIIDFVKDKIITNVDQVLISPSKLKQLEDAVYSNFKLRLKNFRYKDKLEWYASVSQDLQFFSPLSKVEIPDDEIWVCLDDNVSVDKSKYPYLLIL